MIPDHDPIPLPPQPKPLREVDVFPLANLVSEYNNQFGIGGKIFGILMAQIGDEEGMEQARPKISLVQAEERAEPILKATGIGLEAVRGAATMYSQGGEDPTSELRLNLANGRQFTTYLDALDPQSVTETQTEGLVAVANSLTTQLRTQYRLDDPNDDRFFELFGNAERIIANYRRLGGNNEKVAESIQRLDKYIKIARKGYLREYLAAEQQQLLTPPGYHGFGPSAWQIDISTAGYIDRWNRVLATLERIGRNPRAAELYTEALQNLKACTAFARADMDVLQSEKGYGKDMLDTFRITLTEAEKRLEEMTRPPAVG